MVTPIHSTNIYFVSKTFQPMQNSKTLIEQSSFVVYTLQKLRKKRKREIKLKINGKQYDEIHQHIAETEQ